MGVMKAKRLNRPKYILFGFAMAKVTLSLIYKEVKLIRKEIRELKHILLSRPRKNRKFRKVLK